MATFKFIEWLLTWLDGTRVFQFDWDKGNSTKNMTKHGIAVNEAEEVFCCRQYVPLGVQVTPETSEARYGVLGSSKKGKLISVAFTFRKEKVRIISARPMSRKERKLYEQVC